MDKQRYSSKLKQYKQEHLIQFWDNLSDEKRLHLTQQIDSIDFELLNELASKKSQQVNVVELAKKALPPKAIRLNCNPEQAKAARAAGEDAIRNGRVGMVLVAGGQGTRLGFDLPKGMFSIGPLSHRTLFQMHVDSLRGAMKKYQCEIPLFIMTSPATDEDTRSYFTQNDNLGMPSHLLHIFQQGVMPAVDATSGKVLLESDSKIAVSPDGHGGIVDAMKKNGILASCKEKGIAHLFYAQVDNPLVTACDPLLIGHHLNSESEMTTQVVKKRFAKEKVGNVVAIDGKTQIIEYSDLPDEAAERRNPDGSLALWAGNIAVHVISCDFLQKCSEDASSLPFHIAHKAVPYINESGDRVKPTQPNACKFERFVFDLLPKASVALVVEGDAAEVFAPVKNADGAATDTPSSCRTSLSQRFKRWLAAANVETDESTVIEIHPMWALDVEDVKAKFSSPLKINVDTYFA
ncbi:MAG: UTP--glucose-1-phosphate uridylyltransferase [Pirellula sp.]|jgi:UDP-N-acetylglucosamine/UDP-N-acetylgalactosamine diphosphorylase